MLLWVAAGSPVVLQPVYGHAPIPWSRALKQLEAQAGEEAPGRTCWLAPTDPDGRPHLAAVGAIWVDGNFYFTSGRRLRKSRNLAANPSCAANLYASLGWPARASGGAITAEDSAPSAGHGPWDLYEVAPIAATVCEARARIDSPKYEATASPI